MNEHPSLKQAFIHTVFYQILGIGIGVVSGVLLARYLGSQKRGDLAFLVSLCQLLYPLTVIVSGGNDIVGGRKMHRHAPLLAQSIIGVFIIVVMLTVLTFCFLMVAQTDYMIADSDILLTLIYLFFFSLESSVRDIMMSRQKFYYINKWQFVAKLSALVLTASACFLEVISVHTGLLILIVQQGIILVSYLSALPLPNFRKNLNYHVLLLKRTTGINKRILAIYTPGLFMIQIDIILLKIMTDSATVGIYAIAVGVSGLFMAIAGILHRLIKAKAVSEEGGIERAALATKAIVIIGLFGFVLFLLFGQALFLFVYGEAYRQSYNSFIVLWIAVMFWGAGSPLSGYVFAKRQYPKDIILGVNAALVINIILNIWWIPIFHEVGAAMASVVAYGLLFLTYLISFSKIDNRNPMAIFILNNQEQHDILQLIRKVFKSPK